MKRIFFILSIATLISVSPLFSQQTEEPGSNSAEAFAIIPNLEAEESSDIEISRTKVTFTTNVKNCRVYLNGNFQGLTKLTLSNLIEGFYLLRVEKEGFKFTENFVYVERGKAKTFHVELEPAENPQEKEQPEQSEETEPQQNEAALGDIK